MMAKKQARRQDVDRLNQEVRVLQRALAKLRKRLEKYENVEHEFFALENLVETENQGKTEAEAKPDGLICETCGGEAIMMNLGPFDYKVCKGCLKRQRVA